MRYGAILFIGIGCIAMYAFYLGAIKGEIKWEKDKMLYGKQARLVGIVSLIVGLLSLAFGGLLGYMYFSR